MRVDRAGEAASMLLAPGVAVASTPVSIRPLRNACHAFPLGPSAGDVSGCDVSQRLGGARTVVIVVRLDPRVEFVGSVEDAAAESEAGGSDAEVSPVAQGCDGCADDGRGFGDGEQFALGHPMRSGCCWRSAVLAGASGGVGHGVRPLVVIGRYL